GKRIIDELIKFSKVNYSFDLHLSGYRMAPNRCNTNENNLLIFVRNSRSFSFLLIDIDWPDNFGDEKFTIERKLAIPPQLVIIIDNVSYKTNVLEMENDIKSRYDNVVKVIRLKNKSQFDTKFVKVEFNSPKARDDILNKGYMTIDYIKHDVKEYLPQASILICSNCMGLGHFCNQCKQTNATCKVCSEQVKDVSTHQCQGVVKCLHCGGAHHSNDLKCMSLKNGLPKKEKNDTKIENDIKAAQLSNGRLDGELKHQVKVIEQLFIPVLDDIMTVLTELNIKDVRAIDADFRSRSGLWKSELKAYWDKRLKL
ncbi:unnamed protein product, partial [Rotaria socialis]